MIDLWLAEMLFVAFVSITNDVKTKPNTPHYLHFASPQLQTFSFILLISVS